ncbi:MAG: hypothetical protein V1779_15920 [bacterium]
MNKLIINIIFVILFTKVVCCDELFCDNSDSLNHTFIGLNFGYLNVVQIKANTQLDDPFCWNKIPTAFGNGYYYGIKLIYNLGNGDNSINSLLLNFCLNNIRTNSQHIGDTFPAYNINQRLVNAMTEWKIELEYYLLSIDMLYNQKFCNEIPFEIRFGFNLSLPVYSNNFLTYNMVTDSVIFAKVQGYKYMNNYRTVVVIDDEIRKLLSSILGIKAEISYSIFLSENIILTPEIGYYYPLSAIVENTDWKLRYLNAGLGIFYRIR